MLKRVSLPDTSPIETARLAINYQDRFLVVQRNPATSKTLGGYWEFPGGKVDASDIFKALILGVSKLAVTGAREVREEAGCAINPYDVGQFITYRDEILADGVRAVAHIASVCVDTKPELAFSREVSDAQLLLPSEFASFASKGNRFRPYTVQLAEAFGQSSRDGAWSLQQVQ